jgi:hypothetical protein
MKRVASVFVVLALTLVASPSAAPTKESWRVLSRATVAGDQQIAVVVAAKRRTTRLAVRVRATEQPATAELHTVVTCNKEGPSGPGVFSRRDKFTVQAPALRVLQLPIAYPENCGVTVIGITHTVQWGHMTIAILASCTVQTNGRCA